MPDILGPAAAGSAVAPTVRPTPPLPNVVGAAPTYFKDCTSVESSDGSEVTAAWLNAITMQFRTAFSGMGIIADNADDMLLRAIQQAQATSSSTSLPLHNHDDHYFTEVEADSRFLRSDASSGVTALGATTTFQNVQMGAGPTIGHSTSLSWRQNGDAGISFSEVVANGAKYVLSYAGTLNAQSQQIMAQGRSGWMRLYGPGAGLYISDQGNNNLFSGLITQNGNLYVSSATGIAMVLNQTEQKILRSGVLRQIATEEKTDTAGDGIRINGATSVAVDGSANKVFSIDPVWLDGQARVRQSRTAKTTSYYRVSAGANGFNTGSPLPNPATGLELCSMVFTPKNADSTLEFTIFGAAFNVGKAGQITLALFEDGVSTPVCMVSDGGYGAVSYAPFARNAAALASSATRVYRLKAYASSTVSDDIFNGTDVLVNGWFHVTITTPMEAPGYSAAPFANGVLSTGFTINEVKP
jgi:hypothetical protein